MLPSLKYCFTTAKVVDTLLISSNRCPSRSIWDTWRLLCNNYIWILVYLLCHILLAYRYILGIRFFLGTQDKPFVCCVWVLALFCRG